MRLRFPLKIEFEITSKCNMKCKHCMLNLDQKRQELSTDKIYRLIDKWVERGLLELQLTGGEPLLRPDLIDIIEYAANKNLKVLISTNGTLITEEFAERLSFTGAYIEISLDGSCKEIHDSIRGVGAFDKTINGIHILKKYSNRIMIETVIQQKNYKDIINIYELACSLGAYRHLFHSLRLSKQNHINMGLEIDIMRKVQETIFALKNERKIQVQPPYLPVDYYYEMANTSLFESKVFGCGALKFKCGVAADGNVYPCLLFSDVDDFVLGNVNEKNLYDIWNSTNALQYYEQFHTGLPVECTECKAKEHCDGGCRKVSYVFKSNLKSQDLSCPYARG